MSPDWIVSLFILFSRGRYCSIREGIHMLRTPSQKKKKKNHPPNTAFLSVDKIKILSKVRATYMVNKDGRPTSPPASTTPRTLIPGSLPSTASAQRSRAKRSAAKRSRGASDGGQRLKMKALRVARPSWQPGLMVNGPSHSHSTEALRQQWPGAAVTSQMLKSS
jgi:hypothetical protein